MQRQAGECVRQQGRGVLLRELLPHALREKVRRMREGRDNILTQIYVSFYLLPFNCLQVILGEGLRFGEQNYHRACFKCSVCGQALAQGAAHSIKVGSLGNSLYVSYLYTQGMPACGECYDNQFKEKCVVCHQVVTGG